MSPTSHSRNATASSISSFGSGGGLTLSSAAISPTRASHRPPVLHAKPHVREHRLERRDQFGALRLVGDAVEVDVDEAFARGSPCARRAAPRSRSAGPTASRATVNTGCTTSRDLDAALGQLAHHRIEQERHVVVDDLDHRDVAQQLAGAGRRWRCAASARRACARAKKRPGRFGQRDDLAPVIADEVFRRRAVEQAGDEIRREPKGFERSRAPPPRRRAGPQSAPRRFQRRCCMNGP